MEMPAEASIYEAWRRLCGYRPVRVSNLVSSGKGTGLVAESDTSARLASHILPAYDRGNAKSTLVARFLSRTRRVGTEGSRGEPSPLCGNRPEDLSGTILSVEQF